MYPFDYPLLQGCAKRARSSVNLMDCIVKTLFAYPTIFHLPCQSDGIEFINIILYDHPRRETIGKRQDRTAQKRPLNGLIDTLKGH